MKAMVRKWGVVITAAAVLLTAVALVVSCPAGSPSGYQPPEGMGAVRLNFNQDILRATFLPDDADISDFTVFYFNFVPTGTGTPVGTATQLYVNYAQRASAIEVPEGLYNLTIIGYLEGAVTGGSGISTTAPTDLGVGVATASTTGGSIIGGSGAANTIDLQTGGNEDLVVALKAYDPVAATGNGRFAWKVTNSLTATPTPVPTVATVTVRDLTGAVITTPTNFTGGVNMLPNMDNTSPPAPALPGVPLIANYYYVDFDLEVNGIAMTFRHVLQIYQGMLTTFTYEITDTHFGIMTGTVTVAVGDWSVDPFERLTVLLDVYDEGDDVTVSLAVDSTTGSGPLTIALDATTVTDFTGGTFAWFLDGTAMPGTAVAGNGTLTIDCDEAPFDATPFDVAGGPYILNVNATTASGVPFSTFVYLTITP